MDFLWHEVNEKEKQEIKKQAKDILDSFSNKLSKIDSKKLKEPLIERDEYEREENGKPNEIDRDIMFSNFRIKDSDSARKSENDGDFRHAHEKNENFIIAEKKKW